MTCCLILLVKTVGPHHLPDSAPKFGLRPVSQQIQPNIFCSHLQHKHIHSIGCKSQAQGQLIPAGLDNGWRWRELGGGRQGEGKLLLPPPQLP